MKSSAPLNYQQAGLNPPSQPDTGPTPASMAKLRIFKDHLNETPIIIIFVGSTTFKMETIEVHDRKDFITLVAALKDFETVLTHIDYEMLPQLDLLSQTIGARIYVLEDVPDLERTPSEMMAVGGYRHRVSLEDYMTIVSGTELPALDGHTDSAAPETDVEDDAE